MQKIDVLHLEKRNQEAKAFRVCKYKNSPFGHFCHRCLPNRPDEPGWLGILERIRFRMQKKISKFFKVSGRQAEVAMERLTPLAFPAD